MLNFMNKLYRLLFCRFILFTFIVWREQLLLNFLVFNRREKKVIQDWNNIRMSKWLHDDSCVIHLSFNDSFWLEVMILCFFCAVLIDVLINMVGLRVTRYLLCAMQPQCLVRPSLHFYQPWALSRCLTWQKLGPPRSHTTKEVLLFTGELIVEKLPRGEKRAWQNAAWIIFSQWYLLGWAKHRLVSGGHLEMVMNQLALTENTSDLFLL